MILASDTVSLLIPIHTHNNVYWSSSIFEYTSSDKEILDRFFLLARLFGLDEKRVVNYILTDEDKNLMGLFGMRYKGLGYKIPHGIKVSSPQEIQEFYDYIIQHYRIFQKEDIKTFLMRFRVDYLFYSPYEQLISKGRFKIQSFLDKVYDYHGTQIYKIIK